MNENQIINKLKSPKKDLNTNRFNLNNVCVDILSLKNYKYHNYRIYLF